MNNTKIPYQGNTIEGFDFKIEFALALENLLMKRQWFNRISFWLKKFDFFCLAAY